MCGQCGLFIRIPSGPAPGGAGPERGRVRSNLNPRSHAAILLLSSEHGNFGRSCL